MPLPRQLITTTWRVTLAGVLLLDYGHYLTEEPQIEQTGTPPQVRRPIGAAYADQTPRGHVQHTIGFERHTRAASIGLAEKARVDLLRALAALAKGDCVIQFIGGGSSTLKNALLSRPFTPRIEDEWLSAPIKITGGELEATTGVPA